MWNDGILEYWKIGMLDSWNLNIFPLFHYSIIHSVGDNLMAHPKSKSASKKPSPTLSRDQALHFYRQMLKIRLFEEQVNQLYLGAKMPGRLISISDRKRLPSASGSAPAR